MKVPVNFYSHVTKQQTMTSWDLPDPPPGRAKLNPKGLSLICEMFHPPRGLNFNVYFLSVSQPNGTVLVDSAISQEQARVRLSRLIQSANVQQSLAKPVAAAKRHASPTKPKTRPLNP